MKKVLYIIALFIFAISIVSCKSSKIETSQTDNIAPQTFEPFERKGFTVVEWGGTFIEN